jgi:ATP-dependent DNA helicase RecG
MTATPIPRSLQLTLFGDLDISIIDKLPKGRRPVSTKIISPSSRAEMDTKIAEELKKGRQVYFIAPLIEEKPFARAAPATEMSTILARAAPAKENVENLAAKIKKTFKGYQIAVLHGRQPAEHKEKIMREFAAGSVQILVATTVIEVGVDVPNASIMVIENADQFGLAQLHQLRGRVGRGEHQSFCYLVQSDNNSLTRRLREIERSNDGFYLAEIDLKLRGGGEIYGTAQHGELNLQIASLSDSKLIALAAHAADWFMTSGQNLLQYKSLAVGVRRYQRLTTLN